MNYYLVAQLKLNSKTTCCGSKSIIKTFSITLHGWIHGFHLLSYEFQDDRTLTPPPPLRLYENIIIALQFVKRAFLGQTFPVDIYLLNKFPAIFEMGRREMFKKK